MSHGQRWNLRKFASFIIQKVAHPSSINLQLSSATGELLKKKKKKKKNDLFPTTTTFSHKLYKFELYIQLEKEVNKRC